MTDERWSFCGIPAVLLEGRMDGVLLGGVEIEGLGETRFGIRSAGTFEPAAGALCEDQPGRSDRKQE